MECKLCREDEELCESHIVPEFLYEGLYDAEKHRFVQVAGEGQSESKKIFQKGLREPMLCKDCELKLSQWEDYAKRIIFGGEELEQERFKDFLIVRGVEYKKFKLFMLSLIWRAGASTRKEFATITLSPHEEKIRKMLLADNPGEPHEYGCFLILTPSHFETMQGMMMLGQPSRWGQFRCYHFVVAGFTWVFLVDSHLQGLPEKEKFLLSRDGTLPIVIDDKASKVYLEKTVIDWGKTWKIAEATKRMQPRKKK
ncbi:MAG: hypothetical protein ACP5IL_14370 [Syntrophobacteraceae bacterium]